MNLSQAISADFLSRLGRALLSLISIVIFIKVLGAETFGTFVLFEAMVTMGSIGVDFGIGSATQKRVSERSVQSVVSTALALKICLLLAVTGIVIVFRTELNSYFGRNMALFLPAAIGVQQSGRLGLHALRGKLKVTEASVIQLAGDVLVFLIAYLLVRAGYGLSGLIYGFLVGWTLIGLLSFLHVGYTPALPDVQTAKSLFHFSKYTFVASVVGGTLYSWMDTLLIGYILSPSAVAIYESVWRVSSAVTLVSQSIGTALFPMLSDLHSRLDTEKAEEVVRNGLTGSLVIVFPAIVGTLLFGNSILKISFGPEVATATVALVVLLFGKIPESINDVVGRSLYGLNQPKYTAYASVAFLLLNLVLNLLLIETLGVLGAAIGTTIAFTVNTGLNAYFLNDFLDVRPVWRTLGYYAAASLIMGVILVLLTSQFTVNSVRSLFGVVTVGGLSYVLVLMMDKRLREQTKHLFANVRN